MELLTISFMFDHCKSVSKDRIPFIGIQHLFQFQIRDSELQSLKSVKRESVTKIKQSQSKWNKSVTSIDINAGLINIQIKCSSIITF